MTADETHAMFMRQALAEARKGLGLTSPNPAVGAILVRNGAVVARGHHRGSGQPHAEVECLSALRQPIPADATLYVTLEPCSTTGRTPPCTNALIAAGVKSVVVGAIDSNPAHAGRGIDLLRAGGVEVLAGILESECTALNEAFNKWIRTQRPFVIAKCGMTLDGRLTRPPDESQWITSEASRRHANRFRASVDAILVGAETVRRDNPRLTVRGVRGARQPWRIVLTRSGQLPETAQIFTDRFADRTRVFKGQALEEVLHALGKQEITSVLLEGGSEILSEALDSRLIDKFHIYLGGSFSGGPVLAFAGSGAASTDEAPRLRDPYYRRIGNDVFLEATAFYPKLAGE